MFEKSGWLVLASYTNEDELEIAVGFGVTVISILLQFVASVFALRIAISSRRLSLLPFALAILLMGLRRSYSLYSKLAFERPIDTGAELIALMISILMLVGLIGFRHSLAFPQDSPQKKDSRGFQFNLAKSAILLGCIIVFASSAIGFFSYSSSRDLMLETIKDNNLTLARLVARQSELQAENGNRRVLLKQAEQIWNHTHHPFKKSHLGIIDSEGILLSHTQMPQVLGQSVADLPLEKGLSLKPRSVGELAVHWVKNGAGILSRRTDKSKSLRFLQRQHLIACLPFISRWRRWNLPFAKLCCLGQRPSPLSHFCCCRCR